MTIDKAIKIVQETLPFENYTDKAMEAHQNIARTILKYLQRGATILDFGCGACDKTAVISLLGFKCLACDDLQDVWHGVDNNKNKIINFAQKMGIDFRFLDSRTIVFKKNAFDMIMMHDVLEHILGSPRDLLNNLLGFLKSEGLLFITVPNAVSLRKRINILKGKQAISFEQFYWYPNPWRGHIREYTRDDLLKLADYLNLKILELRGCNHRLWRLPAFARPIYKILTEIFDSWCDTLLFVGQKRPDWMPKSSLPEDQLNKIFGNYY